MLAEPIFCNKNVEIGNSYTLQKMDLKMFMFCEEFC